MKNFLGRDGFVWWIGVVEDIADPLDMGRCRVRIIGYHPQLERPKATIDPLLQKVKTEELPWAISIHPVNLPNFYGTPKLGDWVVGFFLDGELGHEPAIFGIIPGTPEIRTTYKGYFGEYPRFVPTFSKVQNDETPGKTVIFNTIHNYVDPITKLPITIPQEGADLTEAELSTTQTDIGIAEKTNDKTFGIIHSSGSQIQIKDYETELFDIIHEFFVKNKNGSNLIFKETVKLNGDVDDIAKFEHQTESGIQFKNNSVVSGDFDKTSSFYDSNGNSVSLKNTLTGSALDTSMVLSGDAGSLTFKDTSGSGTPDTSLILQHANGNKLQFTNIGIDTSITLQHASGTSINIDRLGNLTITGVKSTTINTTDNFSVTAKNISLTGTQSLTIADPVASYSPTSIKAKFDQLDAKDAALDAKDAALDAKDASQDAEIEVAKTLPVAPSP